ncbi:MAG TPA: hypothetical protein VMB50_16120, partial [Myxococcales bacterium]|nr:hypothetical protein [Myxococcales bacterium]
AGGCDGFNCQEVVGLGEACGPQSTICSPLLACNGLQLCENPGGVNVSCGSDGDCEEGLYCDPNLLECLFRLGDGGACPTGGCAFGFACAYPTGVSPDGGAAPTCQPMFPDGPCVGGFCLEGEGCLDGGCVAQPGLGGACADGGVPCLAGACVSGQCQELGEGQACQNDQACQTGLCGGTGTQPVCAGACVSL